jgi:hypothetical protein
VALDQIAETSSVVATIVGELLSKPDALVRFVPFTGRSPTYDRLALAGPILLVLGLAVRRSQRRRSSAEQLEADGERQSES